MCSRQSEVRPLVECVYNCHNGLWPIRWGSISHLTIISTDGPALTLRILKSYIKYLQDGRGIKITGWSTGFLSLRSQVHYLPSFHLSFITHSKRSHSR